MGFWRKVGNVLKGFIPGYEEMKEREYKEGMLKNEEHKIKLEEYKIAQSREDRENEQKKYYESQKNLATNAYFLENAWPLLMPPEYMPLRKNQEGKVVMRVILAESNDPNYQNTLGNSIKNRLNSIMTEIFSEFSSHPISFYFDGWKKNHNGGTPSLDALYQILKGQPTLVIMPIISDHGETLLLRTAFWGIGTGGENPMCLDFLKIPLGRIERDVSREYAKQWRDFKRRITPEQLELNINSIDEENLKLLAIEEQFINKDMSMNDIEKRTVIHYKYNVGDRRLCEDVVDYLVASIEATISYISDIYYLVEYNVSAITPYILSTLKHPSYLPSVAQQILPLYEASRELIQIEGKKNTFIDVTQYSLNELLEKVTYLIKISGCNPKKMQPEYCAIRLIWDERFSELLQIWLGVHPSDYNIEVVTSYILKLMKELDETIWDAGVKNLVHKLSCDRNKDSIIFAIISRHTLIREFKQFVELASYRMYMNFKFDGRGINWLLAYKLADEIANVALDKDKRLITTPSMYIENNKKDLANMLRALLTEFNLKFDIKKLEVCMKDGMLLENIRKMADLFLEFKISDIKYMQIMN